MTKHVAELIGDFPSVAADTALTDRKELATTAFERTRTPLVITDARQPDHPIVLANKAFLQLTGYRADEVLGRNCRFLQGEATSASAVSEIRSVIKAERDVSVELLNYHKNGSSFWNLLHLSPVHDEAGKLLYHFGSQIDQTKSREVDELKKAEHRLLMEVDHRAKNVLALVGSIMRLSRSDDPHQYATAVQQRVQSLAGTHALLSEHSWRPLRLGQIVMQQLPASGIHRFCVEGPELEVDPQMVQPLGLVIHELALNASQHGCLRSPSGHVTIQWAQLPFDQGFTIQWAESGGPPIKEPLESGFGLLIADGIVRGQLFGNIQRRWERSGLVVTIEVPQPHSTF